MDSDLTQWIFFALPDTAGNRNLLARIAIIEFVDGISGADRLALFNGTMTLAQAAAAYPALVPRMNEEARNFTDGWSSDGGVTLTHRLGVYRCTLSRWLMLRDQLPNAPAGFRYAMFDSPPASARQDVAILRESNVTGLTNFINTLQSPRLMIDVAGLVPITPGGSRH